MSATTSVVTVGVAGSSGDEQPVTKAVQARTAMEKKSFMSSDVVVIVPACLDEAVDAQERIGLGLRYASESFSVNGGGSHCLERSWAHLRSGTSEHFSYHHQRRVKVHTKGCGGR